MKTPEIIVWVGCTLAVVIFLVILAVQNVITMNRIDKKEKEEKEKAKQKKTFVI